MIPCPECGYDLHAIASERCPECGTSVDRAALSRSQIPWSHRGQIGWWRAYWRTARMILWRPSLLAAEMERPVDYRDAQRFRWLTVLSLAANLVGVFLDWFYNDETILREMNYSSLAHYWVDNTVVHRWAVCMSAAGMLMGVTLLTGVCSYFFHPRWLSIERQNRAIALSYYPSALLVPAMVCADLALVGADVGRVVYPAIASAMPLFTVLESLLVAVLCMGFALLLAFGWNTLVLLRRTTHCGIPRLMAASLALGGSLAFVPLLAIGVPLGAHWIVLMLGGG